jgi:hypothetical protein
LLLLSLLDLGYLSFWTIPPVAVTTLLSHFIFPFLAYAPRPESSPSYFSTVIVCVYTLPIAWFIASVSAFTVVAMENRWEWKLDAVKAAGGAATQGAQNVQVLFSWVEVGLLLMFEVKAHRRLNIEGEPESWRPPIPEIPEQDKSMVGPSTVMFDAREPNGREDKQVSGFFVSCQPEMLMVWTGEPELLR